MAKNKPESGRIIKKGSLADIEERRKSSKRESIVPQKKKNLLRVVKLIILVFAVLGILCFVLSKVNSCLKSEEEPTVYGELNFNPEGILSVDYYEPDYSANIFEDTDYLAKDRSIRYVDGSIGIVLDEYEDGALEPGQRFFKKYFGAVINGDYESYHGFFADDCEVNPGVYGKNLKTKKFPMQRLYNVSVKELFVSEDENNIYNGKTAIYGVYEVSYCIMKNDGEYRLGLPSDKIIPVIYQTATTDAGTDNEKTVITKAYLYSDIEESEEGNEA